MGGIDTNAYTKGTQGMTSIRKNVVNRPTRRGGVNRPKRNSLNTPTARADRTSFAGTKRKYERYMALAREAAANGDLIESENMFQHAEHYLRQMQE